LGGPVNTTYSCGIVALRRDNSSDVATVAIIVNGIVVIICEIPATNIVNKTVTVIVDTVTRDFTGITPNVVQ
jgi:hypothetical protein